jgi:2-oxoisovalerate dehydrogenase E2 component (dihydrolipoyl transacylase)
MMGVHVIKMPDIGEGIAEVELVAWHVKPGDTVVEDQTLADVMTDKANVEIPSPVAGQVLALGGEVGEVLAVGSELIRIEIAGTGNAKEAPRAAAAAPPPVAPSPPPPSARPAAPPVQAQAARAPTDKPIASPSVRRRAWELGIDLQNVAGTGAAGRIMQADLDASAARGMGAPAPGARAASYAERHDEQAIPVIGLRRKIAQKMQESKRRIPHFSYVEEVDVSELELLRARLNAEHGAARPHLTLMPFLVRALVLAARQFPQINARFDDEAGVVTRHGAVHVGIATQTDAGLLVPVLRHAESRDLWSSASEVARLAEAARAGKATRDELSGSTITITSLGALGGIASTPVINHPEVAIVGVNRIVLRPVMRGGAVVARQMMNLSSSFDHRVVDGQYAAAFVQSLRERLESPATLFVE